MTHKPMTKDEVPALPDSWDARRAYMAGWNDHGVTIAAWNVSPSADVARVVDAARAFIGSATLNSVKGRELRAALSQLAQKSEPLPPGVYSDAAIAADYAAQLAQQGGESKE